MFLISICAAATVEISKAKSTGKLTDKLVEEQGDLELAEARRYRNYDLFIFLYLFIEIR